MTAAIAGLVAFSLAGVPTALAAVTPVRLVVNGRALGADAAPLLVGERLLAPARAVAEALGATVDWDAALRVVSITLGDRRVLLAVDKNLASVNGVARDVNPPARLHRDRVYVPLRFVGEALGAKVGWDPRTRTATVEGPKATAGSTGTGGGTGQAAPARVTGVAVERANGREVVRITGTGPLVDRSFTLTEPHRIVMDFDRATLVPGPLQVAGAGNVVAVRAAQFQTNPDVVRVVVELKSPAAHSVSGSPDGLVVDFALAVTAVTYRKVPGAGRLTIRTAAAATPEVTRPSSRRIVLTIPNAVLRAAPPASPGDNVVRAVRVEQVASQGDVPAAVRVELDLPYYLGHQLHVEGGKAEATITLELAESSLYGKTIVVDAGHGGNDPGTSGPAGTDEKHLTLAMARQLKAVLEQAGAKVLLTREGDQALTPYERSAIANAARADALISLHLNSYQDRNLGGTETYHYRNHSASARLASLVHREMTAGLGLDDRGVRRERFAVLRTAKMPAVLVEAAYLSNPREEALMRDAASHRRVAESLLEALLAFFR